MTIRHLTTSWRGPVIAAGKFEHKVHVWDLGTSSHVATFDTILDFGGKRLAITNDGKNCIAAAYRMEGIAAYSTSDGAEIWHRKDLKKAQSIRISPDDCLIYAGFDQKSCHILDRHTGKTIRTLHGVRDVWENPFRKVLLQEKRKLVLQAPDKQNVTALNRESFAVLSVAFAPAYLCISESGGPLRCLDVNTGEEIWRWSRKGHHFLEMAYAEQANAFVGVCWPYEHGGSHRLFRFEPVSGKISSDSDLGSSAEFAFCQRGGCLLSSDGLVIDSVTGRRRTVLDFPTSH